MSAGGWRTEELAKAPDHVGQPSRARIIAVAAELVAYGPDVVNSLQAE